MKWNKLSEIKPPYASEYLTYDPKQPGQDKFMIDLWDEWSDNPRDKNERVVGFECDHAKTVTHWAFLEDPEEYKGVRK